ncbi:hypothetical protein FGO68_gene441 [Halteria grandinella]|uniref:Uncharacterized protein n=1 Tax=Halteria grandinella TaxID=5974 RepID=A0A8J8P1M2_HALGN|nr:hypothetical protein FGO68_gene441 [Halteria grandinella]
MERFILYEISPVEASLISQKPKSLIILLPDLKPVSLSLIVGLSLLMDRNFSSSGFSIIFLRILDSNSMAPSSLSLFFPISLYSFSTRASSLSLKLYSSIDLFRLFQVLTTEAFMLILSPCFLRISWYISITFTVGLLSFKKPYDLLKVHLCQSIRQCMIIEAPRLSLSPQRRTTFQSDDKAFQRH